MHAHEPVTRPQGLNTYPATLPSAAYPRHPAR